MAEWAEWLGIRCLLLFLCEQALHLLAFGVSGFLAHPWFVVDLFVVSVSLAVELSEEELVEHWHLCKAVRLWKIAAFCFDVGLLEKEAGELQLVEDLRSETEHRPPTSRDPTSELRV